MVPDILSFHLRKPFCALINTFIEPWFGAKRICNGYSYIPFGFPIRNSLRSLEILFYISFDGLDDTTEKLSNHFRSRRLADVLWVCVYGFRAPTYQ